MAEIDKMYVGIYADPKGMKKGLDQAKGQLNSFGTQMKSLIGGLVGIGLAKEVAQWAVGLSKAAAAAEGVEMAFMRISNQRTLDSLVSATRGTVSNLELMRKAVMAQNLGLPIENLASLFEFAAKRAQDTGESVDFLVNSIVTGIGRKSPLILDNLGISAVALKEKLGGAGMEVSSVADVAEAVGKIASEEMAKAGDIAETTQLSIEKVKSSYDNLKITLGEMNNESIKTSENLELVNDVLIAINDDQGLVGFRDKMAEVTSIIKILNPVLALNELAFEGLLKVLGKAAKEATVFKESGFSELKEKAAAAVAHLNQEIGIEITTLSSLNTELKELETQLEQTNIKDRNAIILAQQKIAAKKEEIEVIENLAKAEELARMKAQTPTIGKITAKRSGLLSTDGLNVPTSDLLKFNKVAKETISLTPEMEAFYAATTDAAVGFAANLSDSLGYMLTAKDGFETVFQDLTLMFSDFVSMLGDTILKLAIATGSIPLAIAGVGLKITGGALAGFGSQPTGQITQPLQMGGQLTARVSGRDLEIILNRAQTSTAAIT